MTRTTKTLAMVLLGSLLAVGCASSDQSPSDDDQGGGGGASGGGDGGGGDNNAGGPDEDDAGANVQPTYPTAHPRIYINKNRTRLKAALDGNTKAASRFRTTVDSWVNGADVYAFQAWNGALIGQLTGDPKYCQKAVGTIDAEVTAEEAKIAAGTQPTVAGNSYLHVGDLLGDVALVYDWCFDSVSASQKSRWTSYMNQTMFNLWHHTEAKWGPKSLPWLGWSVDDPLNNYYYSFLRATALVGLATKGENPQADEWIKQFRETKVLGQLVPSFDDNLRGGGSLEGSSYGVSLRNIWGLYDMWYATTGEKLQAKTKHARQSMRWFIHHIVPTLDRFSPNGDQPRDMKAMLFDYQRHYLQGLIQLYPHDPIAGRAKAMLEASTLPQMARPEMQVYDFLYDMADVQSKPLDGLGKYYYASGIGQAYARSGWDKSATWLNFTAGKYFEDHAHQDQGSLMIYKDGWLAYDGVIDSANGIIQETGSHSLVRIDKGGAPLKQKYKTESEMVGVHSGPGWFYSAGDVTAAYAGDPSVSKVQREVLFIEPNTVVVYDRVATGADTTQTWQLVTPVSPSVSGANATINGGTHTMQVQRLVPATGASSSAFSLASSASYKAGYRLDTKMPGGDQRYLHVMSIDGSVRSATAPDESTVNIELSDGKKATVKFDRDEIGATLTFDGKTTQLGAGVDALPE